MAEERLIDDDKDRKYKIRKNADGEDELYIDNPTDEEEEVEAVGFEVPEFDTDDEEAAVMTPEQLAAMRKAREEEEARLKAQLEERLKKARAYYEERNFEGALYELSEAEKIDGENGEVCVLKLKTLSRNFGDYTQVEECAEVADGVMRFCTEEQKEELKAISAPLKIKIEGTRAETEKLNAENEEKKSERRGVFEEKRKKAIKLFAGICVPFAVFLILTAVFGTMMFAREDGVNLVLTIVFASCLLVSFIFLAFGLHRLWEALRNVRLNEKNSSTKLGREYEAKKSELEQLTRIYASFNDISE